MSEHMKKIVHEAYMKGFEMGRMFPAPPRDPSEESPDIGAIRAVKESQRLYEELRLREML